MKLESLNSEKFKNEQLTSDEMLSLNGGGDETPGGTNYNGTHGGVPASYDYAYDSDRGGGVITYHGRSNITYARDYISAI